MFDPEIEQTIEPESDIFYKGRHTTSFASLIKLQGLKGAFVIDTPGIRSFVLGDLRAQDLSRGFAISIHFLVSVTILPVSMTWSQTVP